MSQGEIAIVLDGNKTVDVGFERGSQRLQRVFYSPLDRKCFMAVQDMKHGTVVTVIPVDGQGSVTHISYDVVAAARSIYEKVVARQESDTRESPLENGHVSEKRVNALFYVADQQANVKVLNAKVVTHQKEGPIFGTCSRMAISFIPCVVRSEKSWRGRPMPLTGC